MDTDEGLDVGLQRRSALDDFDSLATAAPAARRPPPMIRCGEAASSGLPSLAAPAEVASQLEQLVGEQADELAAEFAAEKAAVAAEEQPRAVDGFLPGWNTWTGPGVQTGKAQERRRASFSVKAPTLARRDAGQARLVIRERTAGSAACRRHQVREVPFPYQTAEAWEKATRQPVGRLWNTEITHRDLCRPRVAVRMGRVIAPLSRQQLCHAEARKGRKKEKKEKERKGKKKDKREKRGKKK